MKYLNFKTEGFTLVEIVVVASIVALLALSGTIGLRQSGYLSDEAKLNTGRHEVTSALSLTRNYVKTGYICCSLPYIPTSYGMHFELNNSGGNQYLIFADLDDDGAFSASDEVLVKKNLHDEIYFKECFDGTNMVDYTMSSFCDVSMPTFDFEHRGLAYVSTATNQDWMTGDFNLYLEHVDDPSWFNQVNLYQETLLID